MLRPAHPARTMRRANASRTNATAGSDIGEIRNPEPLRCPGVPPVTPHRRHALFGAGRGSLERRFTRRVGSRSGRETPATTARTLIRLSRQ
jgi:hypothetical protein